MGVGEERWCVVTGVRGFAARHLVEMLIRYDLFSVRVADLGPSIKLDPNEEKGTLGEDLRSGRAQYVSADICDKYQVLKACQGAEVVFHMAAPNSSINNYDLHHSVNVKGTKNILDACIELKVKRSLMEFMKLLMGTIIALSNYEGEALVITSNGINGLLTCCIRPASIFGPGDRLLVPTLVSAARAGKLKFLIGDGNNMYDFTYVDNVAHAHICAERALASEGMVAEKAAGEAYFITNMESIKFWEFVSLVLEGLGYERPRIMIPAFVIMPIAHLVEWTYKLLAPYGMNVPQFTPSRIRLLSCSRTFDCSKANDRLGYTPIVPFQEGLRRTIESYSHLRAECQPKKEGPSKSSICLGRGMVADILLWRDKKKTLTTIFILVSIYFNFIAPGYTVITAVSKLLLVASVFVLIHGILPQKVLGYTVEKIPGSSLHFSEEMSRQVALCVVSMWNSTANSLRSLCKGNDWMLFLKVVLSLLILSFLGAISLQNLFIIGLPMAFVVFFMYEKKEQEIDHLVSKIWMQIKT